LTFSFLKAFSLIFSDICVSYPSFRVSVTLRTHKKVEKARRWSCICKRYEGMKGSGGTAPLILKFDTRQRWVVTTLPGRLPTEMCPIISWMWGQVVPRARLDVWIIEEMSWTPLLSRSSRVAIQTYLLTYSLTRLLTYLLT
jgi:hypothetical protein